VEYSIIGADQLTNAAVKIADLLSYSMRISK
jgi:hypothetical protein